VEKVIKAAAAAGNGKRMWASSDTLRGHDSPQSTLRINSQFEEWRKAGARRPQHPKNARTQ
jgi:hypothetical protein